MLPMWEIGLAMILSSLALTVAVGKASLKIDTKGPALTQITAGRFGLPRPQPTFDSTPLPQQLLCVTNKWRLEFVSCMSYVSHSLAYSVAFCILRHYPWVPLWNAAIGNLRYIITPYYSMCSVTQRAIHSHCLLLSLLCYLQQQCSSSETLP